MKRIAFYGGSFDPLHIGHLAIARKLSEIFDLDEFYFIPAFHAPHKKDKTGHVGFLPLRDACAGDEHGRENQNFDHRIRRARKTLYV